ncbi:MAG: globin domain-containing protein, partial [Porticoccaceae bacterium]
MLNRCTFIVALSASQRWKKTLDLFSVSREEISPVHFSPHAQALANSILQYARHIDRLEAFGPLVGQIVNQHVSLQVLPEQYPIVGTYLPRAIREVLGAEVAIDAVIVAWAAAYQQLADLLIGVEEGVYASSAAAPGGWRGTRAFKVARKVRRERGDRFAVPAARQRRSTDELPARSVHRHQAHRR